MARWRLLEANDCQLLELLAQCERNARSDAASAGIRASCATSEVVRAVHHAAVHDSATSAKARLEDVTRRLLVNKVPAWVYDHTAIRARCLVMLPWSKCHLRLTSAATQASAVAEHSVAERARAFLECVVRTLSDPSYTFGLVEITKLLSDLRKMRHARKADAAQEADAKRGSARSFKALLHVIAMRLRRPSAFDALSDPELRDAHGDFKSLDDPVWRAPDRFVRYEASSSQMCGYRCVVTDVWLQRPLRARWRRPRNVRRSPRMVAKRVWAWTI